MNNNNNNIELLFWKVINNKPLFKYILSLNKTYMQWNNNIPYESVISVKTMIEYGLLGLLKRKVVYGDYILLKDWSMLFKAIKYDHEFYLSLFNNYPEYINKHYHDFIITKCILEECIGAFNVMLTFKVNNENEYHFDIMRSNLNSLYLSLQYSKIDIVYSIVNYNKQLIIDLIDWDRFWYFIFKDKSSINSIMILNLFIDNNILNLNDDQIDLIKLKLNLNQVLKNLNILNLTLNHLFIIIKLLFKFKFIIIKNQNEILNNIGLIYEHQLNLNQLNQSILKYNKFKYNDLKLFIIDIVNLIRCNFNNEFLNHISISSLNYYEGDQFKLLFNEYDNDDNHDKNVAQRLFKLNNSISLIPLYVSFKYGNFKLFLKSYNYIYHSNDYSIIKIFEYCLNKNKQIEFITLLISFLNNKKDHRSYFKPTKLLYLLLKFNNLNLIIKFIDQLYDLIINYIEYDFNSKSNNENEIEHIKSNKYKKLILKLSRNIQSNEILKYIMVSSKFKLFFILDLNRFPSSMLYFKDHKLNQYYNYLQYIDVYNINQNQNQTYTWSMTYSANKFKIYSTVVKEKLKNDFKYINDDYLYSLILSDDHGRILNIINELLQANKLNILYDILKFIIRIGSIHILNIIVSHYPNILISNNNDDGNGGGYYFDQLGLIDLMIIAIRNQNLNMVQYLFNYIKISHQDLLDKSKYNHVRKAKIFVLRNTISIDNMAFIYLNNLLK